MIRTPRLAFPALAVALLGAGLATRPLLAADGAYEVVEVKDGATIRGVCRISEPVEPWEVRVEKDVEKGCKGNHKTERMVHGEDRALANCVVFLKEIKKGKDWPEPMRAEERSAFLDQKGCVYVPHVQWVRADTQLEVANSDQADHNIHGYRENLETTQFNFISPPGTKQTDIAGAFLERPATYLVKCDIHPWMSAYVHVVTHPYYAVTAEKGAGDQKAGEFVLTDVPPGTYKLVCWHEGMEETPNVKDGKVAAYNYSKDVVQEVEVTVKAGETKTHDFTLPAPAKR